MSSAWRRLEEGRMRKKENIKICCDNIASFKETTRKKGHLFELSLNPVTYKLYELSLHFLGKEG